MKKNLIENEKYEKMDEKLRYIWKNSELKLQ
jgi:hypothetical protein